MLQELPMDIQRYIFLFDPTFHLLYEINIKWINTFGFHKRYYEPPNSPCLKQKDLIGKYLITYSD